LIRPVTDNLSRRVLRVDTKPTSCERKAGQRDWCDLDGLSVARPLRWRCRRDPERDAETIYANVLRSMHETPAKRNQRKLLGTVCSAEPDIDGAYLSLQYAFECVDEAFSGEEDTESINGMPESKPF
jgi:hypothetical protein